MMFMPRREAEEDTWPRQHIIEAEIAIAKSGRECKIEEKERGRKRKEECLVN